MNSLRYDGRVAIVTGGGSGIGAAAARELAARGAKVVLNDLGCEVTGIGSDPKRGEAVASGIRAAGGTAIAHFGDIGAPGVADDLLELALTEFGRIDVLVNNAMLQRVANFYDFTREDMVEHLDVGVLGVWGLCAAAWPRFTQQNYGRIVTVGSTAVLGVNKGVPYGFAKGGQVSFNRSLSHIAKMSGQDITSNLILPYAHSAMWEHPQYGAIQDPKMRAELAINKTLLPSEGVATTIAALAHESCPVSGEMYSCANGQVRRVFFGLTEGVARADLTPEYLIDHWRDVDDTSAWEVLNCTSNDVSGMLLERARTLFADAGE